jgi:hypothetical protein
VGACVIDHSDPSALPECLCRVCHPELNEPWTPTKAAAVEDPVEAHQRELRQRHEKRKKEKQQESLKRLQEQHQFESWDPKARAWVRDEKKIEKYNEKLRSEL